MADKTELGTKRTCPETGKNFYDLNKDPIVSPYTGNEYPVSFFEETAPKPTRKPREPVRPDPEEDEDEDEDIEDEAETGPATSGDEDDEDEDVAAPELGEDADEVVLNSDDDDDDEVTPGKVPAGFNEDGVDEDDEDDLILDDDGDDFDLDDADGGIDLGDDEESTTEDEDKA